MARAIRSEWSANVALDATAREREALHTFPRAQSVRLLHVAKRRRDAARERAARLAVCGLLPAVMLAAFVFLTN